MTYARIIMNRRHYILLLLTLLLAASCAKQGMPSGGPKDVTPPRVLSASPESGTLNFDGNTFVIQFDEYVVVKDAENNILVSPPMDPKPEYSTKGHGIQVKIRDSLQPNTTYLFQFKEAIADFNEGNLLPSFEYVFSTGDSLAGHTLRGTVVDALTAAASEEAVTVLLYTADEYAKMLADSLKHTPDSVKAERPKARPAYITRADKQGRFQFNHIAAGNYYVVALEDGDKNMQVGATEPVAFLTGIQTTIAINDSLGTSSKADSTQAADSTARRRCRADVEKLQLRMYKPENQQQRITSSKFVQTGKAVLTALEPLQNPTVKANGETLGWNLNAKRDTLTVWTAREKCDSLRLIVLDPSGINDTLTLRWHSKRGQSQSTSQIPTALKLSCKDKLNYYDSLWIAMPMPMDIGRSKTDSAVSVLRLKDSSMSQVDVRFDTNRMKALILCTFLPGEKYEIRVAARQFTTLWGHTNDSLKATVQVTTTADYGNLRLTLKALADSTGQGITTGKAVVELLDEKGKSVACQQAMLEQAKAVEFNHIAPGKYRIRLVVDRNGNGQWDAGDWHTRRQPEQTLYYKKTLDVRANWDMEEIWELTIVE